MVYLCGVSTSLPGLDRYLTTPPADWLPADEEDGQPAEPTRPDQPARPMSDAEDIDF